MTNKDLGKRVALGSMNVYCWVLPPGSLMPGQQVVKQLSCPHTQSGLLGGCSLAGMGGCMALPAWVPREKAAHRGRQTAVHSHRLTEHSYFPCAADHEFTFILVTGLFSFS